MLFRRRYPARLSEKMRELFWPRKGLTRPARYFAKRVMRLGSSPYSVAVGVAVGVAAAWTPVLGFHILLALFLSYFVGGNLVAAALGTAFANPLTLPFIWASSWEAGNWLLGNDAAAADHSVNLTKLFEHLDLSQLWGPVLKPMLLGCLPLAAATGVLFYILTFIAVRGFQLRRRERLSAKTRERMARAMEGLPVVAPTEVRL